MKESSTSDIDRVFGLTLDMEESYSLSEMDALLQIPSTLLDQFCHLRLNLPPLLSLEKHTEQCD